MKMVMICWTPDMKLQNLRICRKFIKYLVSLTDFFHLFKVEILYLENMKCSKIFKLKLHLWESIKNVKELLFLLSFVNPISFHNWNLF